MIVEGISYRSQYPPYPVDPAPCAKARCAAGARPKIPTHPSQRCHAGLLIAPCPAPAIPHSALPRHLADLTQRHAPVGDRAGNSRKLSGASASFWMRAHRPRPSTWVRSDATSGMTCGRCRAMSTAIPPDPSSQTPCAAMYCDCKHGVIAMNGRAVRQFVDVACPD